METVIITKICSNCKKDKPLPDFALYSSKKVSNLCKKCKNIKQSIYREKNKESVASFFKNYYIKNKEKIYASQNKKKKIDVEELGNNYIKHRIRAYIREEFNIKISAKNIPQELIKLKQIQLKTFRLCQQLKN